MYSHTALHDRSVDTQLSLYYAHRARLQRLKRKTGARSGKASWMTLLFLTLVASGAIAVLLNAVTLTHS